MADKKMNYFEELELQHYGSFELHRHVGPNLMKGLAYSFLFHALIVVAPLVYELLKGEEEIPPPPLRVVDISQLTKLKRLQEQTAEQVKIALPKLAAPKAMIPIAVEEDIVELDQELLPTMKDIASAFDAPSSGEELNLRPGEVIEIRDDEASDVIPDAGKFIPFEVPPQPLPDFSPMPAFPSLAATSGVPGRVIVLAYVDKTGIVKKWQIKSANPPGLGFEEEVIKVIQKWKFTPAIQNKTPVGVWIEVPFTFNIDR
jgi:TonB family protein